MEKRIYTIVISLLFVTGIFGQAELIPGTWKIDKVNPSKEFTDDMRIGEFHFFSDGTAISEFNEEAESARWEFDAKLKLLHVWGIKNGIEKGPSETTKVVKLDEGKLILYDERTKKKIYLKRIGD